MRALWIIAVLLLVTGEGWAEDALGTRPLLTIARKDLPTILPSDSHILIDPHSIEQFLDALDGRPPDWDVVYGRGHYDSGLDERLFTLNRERDAKRAGKEALQWMVVFLWSGELSHYRSDDWWVRSSHWADSSRQPGGVWSDSNPKKSQVISS